MISVCVIVEIFSGEAPVTTCMNPSDPIYLEFVDFIAGGTTPQDVVDFCPSAEAQERVSELIEREREWQLTADETAELNHFLEIEHLLRMAKAKARLILKNRS
jgi:hypothetical protein